MGQKHVEAIYSLSPSQQGMLFETLSASKPGIHVEQFAWSMGGDLDPAAFERAWQRVVERHAILRTCFVWQDRDEPLQVALRRVRVPLERQDWRGLEQSQQSDKLDVHLRESRQQPFKLNKAPLMRLALFETGERECQVVWTFHHILMDGWSALVIAQEVLSFYEALSKGRDLHLDPGRPYQDYVRWLQRQKLDQAQAFWKRRLAGFARPTPLGTPTEPGDSSEQLYGEQTACLSASATTRLRSLVRQRQLTLNTLIQGVWALLLSRYSGATDVVFGVTVSGRPTDLAGMESLVGSFINTVPMRLDIPTSSPLWPWLETVQTQNLAQQHYEYCSSGQIRQWLELPPSVPLYESLLIFENYPADSLSGQLVDVRDVRYVGAQTNHALTALVFPDEDLKIILIYDQRRFDAPDVARISEHWLAMLESIAALPDQRMQAMVSGIPDEQIPKVKALQKRVLGGLGDFTPPRNALELQLAEVWEDVLDARPIGAHDNFFELGGHSLLATQIISRLREAFQVELPVRELFEAPTVAQLVAVIEARRDGEHTLAQPIAPAAREGNIPLSFAQQRLWFLHQLEGPNAAYNIPTALRFSGPLDVKALEGALNEIVRRHEALRTNFNTVDDKPAQVIATVLNIPLPIIDLRLMPEDEQETQVKQLAAREAQRPFDLAADPLIRAGLLMVSKPTRPGSRDSLTLAGSARDDPQSSVPDPQAPISRPDHVLLLTMHHIVSDGWSVGVLARELMALYAALTAEQASPLPELEVQYADFAMWQREWLSGKVLEEQLGYWKQQLANAPTLLELPTDRLRPVMQTFSGGSVRFEIDQDLTERLKALSRQAGTSLFMTLYAGFATLLSRYSGQEDVVIGAPIANRARQEIEPLVGFFVNTLALRVDLSGDPTFLGLLRRARQVTLDAYAHQDIPFEQLVEALQPERNLGHSPLFQVLFAFQNAPLPPLDLPDLSVTPLDLPSVTSKFDLTLDLEETACPEPGRTGASLEGTVEYNTDLFDRATILRLTEHFRTLLDGDPAQRTSDLPLLTEAEQRQILRVWNDTRTNYVPIGHVHQLIEAQVQRTPSTLALIFEDQRLTYTQLNQRANQLARYLRKLGVGPETLVGISMERSPEMVVGILGIIKAGGAYVPIDPTYPSERVAFMLEDARTPVLLTQERLLEQLPPHQGRVICLDSQWQTIALEAGENPVSQVRDDNLVYMIYTSGSTGKPKGAMNVHSAIRNRLLWMQEMYPLDETDRVLQKTPCSFDVSVWEFLWPFMTGACLVVARPEGHRDSAYLVRMVIEQGVTTMHFVPSMLQAFVEEPGLAECVSLRRVICSGEALPFDLQERFFARLGSTELHNLYGPTEAAVDVSFWPCQRESERRVVPIGWPIANTQLYLLDPRPRPVPVGVSGELHIGGQNLARGYQGRPGLTAGKFIPHPFSAEPGARLYKTGDLTRYLPDGAIQFLGRTDFQVKLRGLRIELGEIEAALARQPGVRECVVIVRQDHPGGASPAGKLLVAYVIGQVTQSQLRNDLKQELPDFMIPSAFVFLEALPLTLNGKVNRRALPAPDRTGLEGEHVAPRTPREEILAGIWAEVLGLEQVGVDDNFFALGGHSLLATQIVSRLRQAFQVELPVRELFEAPTIAQLSAAVEAARAGTGALAPPIAPVGREQGLPLSFAQQRLWFLDQLEGSSAAYNVSPALRLSGPLDVEALESAFNEILRRHEALRTTFATTDREPVQAIAPTLTLPLPIVDLRHLPDDQQAGAIKRLSIEQSQLPFDLTTGPLLRATLLRISNAQSLISNPDHILLFAVHHIVFDGWSASVLARELTTLYQALAGGQPSPLPELAIQYADFAVWQRQWLSGETLEKQLAYWQGQLANAPALLELPSDRSHPVTQALQGGQQELDLPEKLADALRSLSRQENVSLFMTMLAAFKVLLHRYTGQEDIIVGSPTAGRNQRETERLIGLFLNTLVLRTDLAGNPTFRELVGRVRAATLGAFEHQDIPFEKLVEELQPERSLNWHPLFDILFNFVDTIDAKLDFPDFTAVPLEPVEPESKFSLTLYVSERERGLSLELVYRKALFSAARMSQLLDQFRYLLEQIVVQPDAPIDAYSLRTSSSRSLLPDLRAVLPEPPHRPLTESFMAWVERAPSQPAVCQGPRALTYRQLADSACALARDLISQGVQPGDVVAVYGPPSPGLIASMMGVFMSGGVLLTLDPNLPAQRQSLMLQEAGAVHLLNVTPGHLEFQAPPQTLINPDTGSFAGQEEATVSLPELSPADAAYVFFTSGTTGVPKGVLGCHKGLAHFLDWQRETFAVGPEDRSAQMTALSFDVVLRDIFLPLTSGATLCLPHQQDVLDANRVLAWMAHQRVSLLHTVPALAQTWLAELAPDTPLPALRQVFFAGEPLTQSLVRRWRETFPAAGQIINLYGPTETTLAKCYYRVPQEVLAGVQPIGNPLPQTQALVLDPDDRLCGVGEPGQIVIRTPFRTLGFLNPSQQDGRLFAPNPLRDDPEDLLYYTGDRGRYRPDGSLDILGRLDDQVKIRGIRVEPREVEAVLSEHPDVAECAIVVGQKPGSVGVEKYLAAYVVPRPGSALRPQALRHFIGGKLPSAMWPSAYVFMEALPLTANGKVNRRALPAPERTDLEGEHVAPRTPSEEILAGIWAEVLGLEQVGVDDDFFALGGHSLLATQVVSRLRHAFQVELPVRELFEAPSIAQLSAAIEAARAGTGALAPPIVPVSREQGLPLSFAQQRLWFLDQLEGSSAAYNIPAALRLSGPLDVEALESAFNEILCRHESLRTTFAIADGEPVQIIAPTLNLPLPRVDLRNLPDDQQAAAIRRLSIEQAQKPFNLSTGPLFRATLLTTSDIQAPAPDHILLFTSHHIASDAWSNGIIARELTALYVAFLSDKPSPLPELEVQYADFAVWQRQWLSGETLADQLAYWSQQLAGAPTLLELPTDRPRPPVQSFQGDAYHFEIEQDLAERLKALSRQAGVSPFMTFYTAFAALLSRYSGQQDVVIGAPIANRNRQELEPLIGFFVNTLALRADLSGDPTFLELLDRARQATLDAYAHQDIPFERLVEEIQPERNLSHTPLFQVTFVFHNAPWVPMELPDLRVSPLDVESVAAPFDLTLFLAESSEPGRAGRGLTATVDYSTDLFDLGTIERMMEHYQVLLRGIVANPDQRVANLPLLSETERRQLLEGWNDTAADYDLELGPQHLIAAQARRTPDAVAVTCAGQDLNYRELDQRANQLAHYLQSQGVGPDALVGLYVERSLDMMVGMLGILKAGGAYVPLDPAYPAERLAFILQQAAESWRGATPPLLTQKKRLPDLPPHSARVTCLDSDWPAIAAHSTTAPACAASGHNVAYVAYTSGSTGQPKGVMNTHRGHVNYLYWCAAAYGAGTGIGTLVHSSFAFDFTNTVLFPPLMVGERVVLVPEADDIEALAAAMRSWEGFSFIKITPSHLELLNEQLADGELAGRAHTLVVAADLLHAESIGRWQEHAPETALWNEYGPTETVVGCSALPITSALSPGGVSIGRPISNIQFYIPDDSLQPVPVGVPGELYIGGAGVARGYLDRPALTAKVFVPNPYGDPGTRLYKTGDLARYLPDGNVEFLGRVDFQVKVRGFRVELGEIEALLVQHPDVREATVLLRQDQPGVQQLVAYLVGKGDRGELHEHLRRQLPDYMVPSAFVGLDALPLNANGKVDRRALPAPDWSGETEDHVAPRTLVEETLAGLWAEVLGLERVGVRDDFFQLGGHSLLAVRLMSRIQQVFDKNLPLAILFQGATVELLADLLEQDAVPAWSPLVPIQPHGDKRPFFCVPGLGGNVLYLHQLARSLGPDQPFYGLQAVGLDGESKPYTQVEDMAARHIEAMRTVQPHGPYLLGGHSLGGAVALEMTRQLHEQDEQVALLVIFDTSPSLTASPERLAWDDTQWLVYIASLVERLLVKTLGVSYEVLQPLGPDEQLRYLGERMQAAGWLPPGEINMAQLRGQVRVFQAGNSARYAPQHAPAAPVVLLRASQPFEGSGDTSETTEDPSLGWSEIAQDELRIYDVPGDHVTMMTEPRVRELARRLAASLEQAQPGKDSA